MSTTKNLLITERQKIREHWQKTDAQIGLEIGIIKNWLKTQKHLPEIPSDNKIEFFLTNCKFSIEKTKRSLDMFYTIRSLLPDFYENKHPKLDHMKRLSEVLNVAPMPRLTDTLHRITVIRYKEADPELFSPVDCTAGLFRNIFEIRCNEDLSLGEIFIVDYKHIKIGHVVKITPMFVKKVAFILERVWANRLKELHFLNSPPYVDTLITLARTILSKKLRDRIFVHDNLEDMYKVIPKQLLPADYGGEELPLNKITKLWYQKLEEYADRFDDMENLMVDENLRPEKLENSDILGYHGNFKKIEVD